MEYLREMFAIKSFSIKLKIKTVMCCISVSDLKNILDEWTQIPTGRFQNLGKSHQRRVAATCGES